MTETYRLELNFEDAEGKSRKLSIDNPKTGLTEAEITTAMQAVIDADIFENQGVKLYTAIDSARYVRTNVDEVFDVDNQI